MKKFFSSAFWLPLICALVWLGIRWWYSVEYAALDIEKPRLVGVFLNLFFILLLIALGIFVFYKNNQDRSSFGRFKHIVRLPLAYSCFVSIAMFTFYSFLTNELQLKREMDRIALEEILSNEGLMELSRAENANLAEMSNDQIREQRINQSITMTKPKVIVSLGFLMLVLSSVAYSALALLLTSLLLKR